MSYPGNEIRDVSIPKRQEPENVDQVTNFAIQMIPINGNPGEVDESMLFEDDAGNADTSNTTDI